MTPYFRSYAANFNRIRLLEMIDYREPQLSRRKMQHLPTMRAQEREIGVFFRPQFAEEPESTAIFAGNNSRI